MLHIYIYIFVQFFCRRFSRDQPSKKINIFVRFFRSQPSPPNRKNKQTYILFIFCHRFARGQPSKKYKFEKIQHIYIYFRFFAANFPATSPQKNISFKKIKLIYMCFTFFSADFPATSPPKNISLKIYIFVSVFFPPIFPRPALKKI